MVRVYNGFSDGCPKGTYWPSTPRPRQVVKAKYQRPHGRADGHRGRAGQGDSGRRGLHPGRAGTLETSSGLQGWTGKGAHRRRCAGRPKGRCSRGGPVAAGDEALQEPVRGDGRGGDGAPVPLSARQVRLLPGGGRRGDPPELHGQGTRCQEGGEGRLRRRSPGGGPS